MVLVATCVDKRLDASSEPSLVPAHGGARSADDPRRRPPPAHDKNVDLWKAPHEDYDFRPSCAAARDLDEKTRQDEAYLGECRKEEGGARVRLVRRFVGATSNSGGEEDRKRNDPDSCVGEE